MKRSKRQGFCSSDTADIDDLIESADDALFKQIIANPNHVSAYLLPDRLQMCVITLDLDVTTDNLYLNSLNCMAVILLFVCYISNRTDISVILILYLMRFDII